MFSYSTFCQNPPLSPKPIQICSIRGLSKSSSTWRRATLGRFKETVAASSRKGTPISNEIWNNIDLSNKCMGNRGKVSQTGTNGDSFSTWKSGVHLKILIVILPMYQIMREYRRKKSSSEQSWISKWRLSNKPIENSPFKSRDPKYFCNFSTGGRPSSG